MSKTYRTCQYCKRETLYSEYIEDYMHPGRSKSIYSHICHHCKNDVEKAYHILKQDKKLTKDRKAEENRILNALKEQIGDGCLVLVKKGYADRDEVYCTTTKKLAKGDIILNKYNTLYKVIELVKEEDYKSFVGRFNSIHNNPIQQIFTSSKEVAEYLADALKKLQVDFVKNNLWILKD